MTQKDLRARVKLGLRVLVRNLLDSTTWMVSISISYRVIRQGLGKAWVAGTGAVRFTATVVTIEVEIKVRRVLNLFPRVEAPFIGWVKGQA